MVLNLSNCIEELINSMNSKMEHQLKSTILDMDPGIYKIKSIYEIILDSKESV